MSTSVDELLDDTEIDIEVQEWHDADDVKHKKYEPPHQDPALHELEDISND